MGNCLRVTKFNDIFCYILVLLENKCRFNGKDYIFDIIDITNDYFIILNQKF